MANQRQSMFMGGKAGKKGNKVNQRQMNMEDRESDLNSQELDDLDNNMFNKQSSEQLKLSEQVLNEDMPSRMLNPINPQAPKNHTIYNYKDRRYYTDELVDQLVIHFSHDGD